jgi:hypothetical protein
VLTKSDYESELMLANLASALSSGLATENSTSLTTFNVSSDSFFTMPIALPQGLGGQFAALTGNTEISGGDFSLVA